MSVLREQQEGFARSVTGDVDGIYVQTICEVGLSGARRLGIYQHSIANGLRDALASVFEVVEKLVGSEYFAHVVENYVRTHPSTSGNVHDFGKTFPDYLETFPGLEALPYLPDVARLEWAYHAAFHSPVGSMLNIDKLSQVAESKYDELNFLLSPACYLLHSNYPVLHIWQVNQENYDGDDSVNLDEGGVDIAVAREGKQIVFHSLKPADLVLLKELSSGKTFNVSCETALKLDPDCDVSQVLQDAVMNRILVGFY